MNNDDLLNSLSKLVSEERNPDTAHLDGLSAIELLRKINEQDKLVPAAVEAALPDIASAVDAISNAFVQGGRLIYVGAGTSGRMGVLDATECPPTFGVDNAQVIGLIAGGLDALHTSVEGAEDSLEQGREDLRLQKLSEKDVVVGIAASGRTPYVVGALSYARDTGATTVAVSCNRDAEIAEHADIAISVVVGAEVLTGSTRMKAGTAQKLVLNMLSTASMVQTGKTYQNLMVDVRASNAKLQARAIRIVMQATGCINADAVQALHNSDFEVKPAILMVMTGATYADAIQLLESSSGFLHKAIDKLE